MITTEKLTILYDALREGTYKVDIISTSQRYRHENAIDLVNQGYLKEISTKGYYARFKLTPKGRKYIKEYDKDIREDYGKSTVQTGKF